MVSMKNLIIAGGFIVFSYVEKFYQYVKGRKSLFFTSI